ncbi:DUF6207 family protein [Streptomyces sp. NPDC007189]|uniref:DUF6207 family protein n=1 Tax=unclassified Streptomyces TaxID=2593676 RepID=UPI0033C2217D
MQTTTRLSLFQTALTERWATATDDRTTRTPGEPGVRLGCYLVCARSFPPWSTPRSRPRSEEAYDKAASSPNSGTCATSTSVRMRCGRAG